MVNNLLAGSPRYAPRGRWHPAWALLVAIAIQAGFQLAVGSAGALVARAALGEADGLGEQQIVATLLILLIVSQASIVAMVWFAAGRFGSDRREVLQLDRPGPAASEVVLGILGLVALMGAYNAIVYVLSPGTFLDELGKLVPIVHTPLWPLTAVVLGVGAPASEELLYRGFVLSALAQWRFGFWPAALVVNAVWTAFHFSGSVFPLLPVFMIGLYLSWLLWRTGSIWLSIICHGVANVGNMCFLALYLAAGGT